MMKTKNETTVVAAEAAHLKARERRDSLERRRDFGSPRSIEQLAAELAHHETGHGIVVAQWREALPHYREHLPEVMAQLEALGRLAGEHSQLRAAGRDEDARRLSGQFYDAEASARGQHNTWAGPLGSRRFSWPAYGPPMPPAEMMTKLDTWFAACEQPPAEPAAIAAARADLERAMAVAQEQFERAEADRVEREKALELAAKREAQEAAARARRAREAPRPPSVSDRVAELAERYRQRVAGSQP